MLLAVMAVGSFPEEYRTPSVFLDGGDKMDISALGQLISSVGFPIAIV